MLKPGQRTTIEYRDDGKKRDVIVLRVPQPDQHVLALDVSGLSDADLLAEYAKQYQAYVQFIHESIQDFGTWLDCCGVELEDALPYRKFNPEFIK